MSACSRFYLNQLIVFCLHRIKLIVTQKDLTIKNITRESNEMRDKCEHLERLLDQQRKEYVLKSL